MEFQQNPNNDVNQPVELVKPRKIKEKMKESAEDMALEKKKGTTMNAEEEVYSITIPEPFVYEKDGKLLVFLCKSEDYVMKCPNCPMETRYIVQHLSRNSSCQRYICMDAFKKQFTVYKLINNKTSIRNNQNERKSASRSTLKEQDYEKTKEVERKNRAASRARLKETDYEKAKEVERERKAASRAKQK